MGVDGEEFIANPYKLETTDDELDLDDPPEVIVDYMGDEDEDLFALDEDDDDDDDELEIESASETFDFLPSGRFGDYDYRDDFLTDESDDSDDGELRGAMIDGVFVQSGGESYIQSRLRAAIFGAVNAVNAGGVSDSNDDDEAESKNGNDAAIVNQTQASLHRQPDNEGS